MSNIKKKPNILFVFADQLRASSVGYAGEDRSRHRILMNLHARFLFQDGSVNDASLRTLSRLSRHR